MDKYRKISFQCTKKVKNIHIEKDSEFTFSTMMNLFNPQKNNIINKRHVTPIRCYNIYTSSKK